MIIVIASRATSPEASSCGEANVGACRELAAVAMERTHFIVDIKAHESDNDNCEILS